MTRESAAPAPGRNRYWIWPAAIAVLAVGVVLALFAQRPSPKTAMAPEIPVAAAAAMQEKGSFLLDVREPDEWAVAHIAGATLIPLGELEKRVAEVPRDRDIVVVCRSGNRSKHGRDVLLAAGYPRVASMTGGLMAWKAEGRPTVSGP